MLSRRLFFQGATAKNMLVCVLFFHRLSTKNSNLKLCEVFLLHLGERLVRLDRDVDTFFHRRLVRNILNDTANTHTSQSISSQSLRLVVKCLRPRFFTNFHQILHAVWRWTGVMPNMLRCQITRSTRDCVTCGNY